MVQVKDADKVINFICKNKKNTSRIQEYLVQLEEGDNGDILSAIPILTGVFSFYTKKKTWQGINENEMEIDALLKSVVSNDAEDNGAAIDVEKTDNNTKKKQLAEKKVDAWLHTAYKSYIKILLTYFAHRSVSVQMKCLEALLEIIETEYSMNLQINSNPKGVCKLNFPNSIFIKVIKQVMITERLSKEIFENLNSLFVEYDDLCFYCLKNIYSLVDNQNITKKYPFAMECIPKNTLEILTMITNRKTDLESEVTLLVSVEHMEVDTTEMRKSYKQAFSSAWMALLHLPELPTLIQKKILVNLDTKIIPQLVNPKLLIDFLTDCYDAGGVCSLLALNGLFVLINQYNLDYPEFYTKLYSILDANVFHTKYKARFFYLLDLFLTSTHLPAYLVSAFVKKLARISLFTPGEDLFMLLKFIRNLLIRHPSSRILIHRQNEKEVKSIPTDPFNYDENNPYKSNASKSCLWELQSLRSHYAEDVLKQVFSFKKEFPTVEDDITAYFDKDFESLIASRLDKDINSDNIPPLNFEKRNEIFSLDSEMWCM